MAIVTSSRFQQRVAYALLKALWGHIHIYEGTPPDIAVNPTSGTCLASIEVPAVWEPGVGAISGSNSVATLGVGTLWDAIIAKTGTATYYRIQDRSYSLIAYPYAAAGHIEQGVVSAGGGGGDLVLSNTSLVLGEVVGIADMNRYVPFA